MCNPTFPVVSMVVKDGWHNQVWTEDKPVLLSWQKASVMLVFTDEVKMQPNKRIHLRSSGAF